jgi:alkylation response protein AidB-like acyl-CoA dehydrogenase
MYCIQVVVSRPRKEMRVLTGDDLADFRTWIHEGLERVAPLSRTRGLAESGRRDDTDLCEQLVELGVFGLAVAEGCGGSDIGGAGLAVFLMEAGRCLLPAPYLSTACLAPIAIRWADSGSSHATLLSRIAQGRARVALAVNRIAATPPPRATPAADTYNLTGSLPMVLEADVADWLIVAADTGAGPGLFMVDRNSHGVAVETLRSVDLTRPVAAVSFTGTPATVLGELGSAPELIAQLQDLIRLAVAADAVGGAQRLLEMSVEYAKTRVQFGRPIGEFQAIKHRCADLFVAVEATTATVEAGFEELDQPTASLPVTAAVAAVSAQETYWQAVRTAMQIHGGLALTWEHEVQLYLKRATASEHLLGNPDEELVRLTDLVLADGYDVVREIIG